MKPTLLCMVTWICKTVVSGRWQTLDTASRYLFLMWLFGVVSLHLLFWAFLFEEPCPLSGRKTCTVTAEWYLMLLCDHVMPTLQVRHALLVVIFIQDGVLPHIALTVKTFLLDSFIEDQVISCSCKIQWPSRSSDLTLADLWLWVT